MPEAFCCDCNHPCSPMLISGWGCCKTCRSKDRRDFAAVNTEIPSAAGREFIKKAIQAHLRRVVPA